MMLHNYMHLVPEIERRMRFHRIDTLVLGMGPTAHLVPWLDRSVLANVRTWGCHDAWRIMPVDDLVIMDGPAHRLSPGAAAHDVVLNSRPKNLWFYAPHYKLWDLYIHQPMRPLVKPVDFYCWHLVKQRRAELSLDNDPLDTAFVSPTGTTTLAWREGGRRIGVIGVEMREGDHHTAKHALPVADFFVKISKQAQERGGCIVNLSPITGLKEFEKWTVQSECSSAATTGSKEPVLSESLSTASGGTVPSP